MSFGVVITCLLRCVFAPYIFALQYYLLSSLRLSLTLFTILFRTNFDVYCFIRTHLVFLDNVWCQIIKGDNNLVTRGFNTTHELLSANQSFFVTS